MYTFEVTVKEVGVARLWGVHLIRISGTLKPRYVLKNHTLPQKLSYYRSLPLHRLLA